MISLFAADAAVDTLLRAAHAAARYATPQDAVAAAAKIMMRRDDA